MEVREKANSTKRHSILATRKRGIFFQFGMYRLVMEWKTWKGKGQGVRCKFAMRMTEVDGPVGASTSTSSRSVCGDVW